MTICETCKQELIDLLDKRMRRILEVGREEKADSGDDGEDSDDHGQSICFHLMEIQQIIQGKKTCGVYDDFGSPLTITGPLFSAAAGGNRQEPQK